MATVNPYLVFNGDCEAAFILYKSVFGGDFITFSKFSDMPNNVDSPLSPEDANRVMHVSFPISTDTILMGSDSNSQSGEVAFGDNISISINAESKEEAEKIFNGLAQGGKITMPIQDTFWGAYFGMLKDKFNINWMVNFDYPRN